MSGRVTWCRCRRLLHGGKAVLRRYTFGDRTIRRHHARRSGRTTARLLLGDRIDGSKCDRYGNGSFTSGDGWRYRGRGLIQLTFRDNYAAASEALGRDYVARPEWVALPPDAVLTAAWFWASAGCNELMLRGLFDATTRRINPAMAGASDRRMQFARIAAEMLDASRALA